MLDVARTFVRRGEREVVALADEQPLGDVQAMSYLNRLSSVLFVLARYEDHAAGASPRPAASADA